MSIRQKRSFPTPPSFCVFCHILHIHRTGRLQISISPDRFQMLYVAFRSIMTLNYRLVWTTLCRDASGWFLPMRHRKTRWTLRESLEHQRTVHYFIKLFLFYVSKNKVIKNFTKKFLLTLIVNSLPVILEKLYFCIKTKNFPKYLK